MQFEDKFIKELIKRLKENTELIESSFRQSNIKFNKDKLYDVKPIKHNLPVIVENDPYIFLNKIIYSIINNQKINVSSNNIVCDLLLEIINLILEEFNMERIDKIV